MDQKLPFVWRECGLFRASQIPKLAAFLTDFMHTQTIESFPRYERHRLGAPSSTAIILPGECFFRGDQTYRSDIKWMWKVLAKLPGRMQIGKDGALILLVTDEVRYYNPGNRVQVGSFEDAELLWKWIEFVTSHSWWKQKKGQLRKLFSRTDSVPTMLAEVSTALIEMQP